MKPRMMTRLVSPDGESVTEPFETKAELHKAEAQNPDWKRQSVRVLR